MILLSPYLEYLTDLANRVREKLLQLDRVLQKVLKQENPHSQNSSIRFQWLFEKSKISSLRTDLRDIKLNIVMRLTTSNRSVAESGHGLVEN